MREPRRVGKRIAIGLDGDLWLVLHLMIAGRLHWKPARAAPKGWQNLAAFDFPPGSLTLTEAGSKRRASLHVVAGEPGLLAMDPGGIDALTADLACVSADRVIHALERLGYGVIRQQGSHRARASISH